MKNCYTNANCIAPNPSPSLYKVVFREVYQNCTLMKINYTGCTNFEGDKLLVFVGNFIPEGDLDPHFSNLESSPVARFKPDEQGLSMARWFCRNL